MSDKKTYLAWALLAAAVAAWCAVGFLVASIQSAVALHQTQVSQAGYSSSLNSQVSGLRALIAATATNRAELNAIAVVDPASLADMITSAGESSGIHIAITDANSLSGAPTIPTAGASPTQAFSFIANSTGSFASMMYAVALLESLPAPSVVQQFQLTESPNAPGAPAGKPLWQMNAQIKVVTASAL